MVALAKEKMTQNSFGNLNQPKTADSAYVNKQAT